jgi:hypothetical protein
LSFYCRKLALLGHKDSGSSIWEDAIKFLWQDQGSAIGPDIQYVTPSTNVIEDTWNFPSTGTLPTLAQLKAVEFLV